MSQTRRGTHLYIIIVLYASETPTAFTHIRASISIQRCMICSCRFFSIVLSERHSLPNHNVTVRP